MAWETEKRRLALAKLKAFFLDKIEVERIVLHSLNAHGAFVTTFRTAKLPESVKKELQEAREPQLGVGGGGVLVVVLEPSSQGARVEAATGPCSRMTWASASPRMIQPW